MTDFKKIIIDDLDEFYKNMGSCPGCVLMSHDVLNRLQATVEHPILRLVSESMSMANQMMIDHARASINMCILRHVDEGNIILKPDDGHCELVLSPNAITCGSEKHDRPSADRPSADRPSERESSVHSGGPADSGSAKPRESVREIYNRLVTKLAN